MSGILGKKKNMEQLWQGEKIVPVTIIETVPNQVGLVRTKEKDGYSAIQLKIVPKKAGKKIIVREFRGLDFGEAQKGDEIHVDVLKPGDKVKVTGVTKGRGFQGVVKRHGFGGGPKTHGQKNRFRAPGSIGSTAFQRVVPGRRMAGHMGHDQVSIKGLTVVEVDAENNILKLKGAVPGPKGGLLKIQRVSSNKKLT